MLTGWPTLRVLDAAMDISTAIVVFYACPVADRGEGRLLNRAAIEVLNGAARASPGGLPAPNRTRLSSLQKPLASALRRAAGLEIFVIHDLPALFGLRGCRLGEGLHRIRRLPDYAVAATHRYAHLAADPQVAASELVGDQQV